MQETKALISRWRGNLGVVLERRPQCAFSHEVRRRGQWASRGAPVRSQEKLTWNWKKKQMKGMFGDSVYYTEGFEVNVLQQIKGQRRKNYFQNISSYFYVSICHNCQTFSCKWNSWINNSIFGCGNWFTYCIFEDSVRMLFLVLRRGNLPLGRLTN